jgi:hypothetical protein
MPNSLGTLTGLVLRLLAPLELSLKLQLILRQCV